MLPGTILIVLKYSSIITKLVSPENIKFSLIYYNKIRAVKFLRKNMRR